MLYAVDDELFVSDTTPEAEPDLYGQNTLVRIDHKRNGVTERIERRIGVDAVLFLNDPEKMGLAPLIEEYAALMAQAKITMLNTFVNMRSTRVIQAKDENAKEAAEEYENALRRGDISVLYAEELGDMSGIVVHQTPVAGTPASQVIELTQYVQSMYYGELGQDVNNNMKRSYVSDSELEKTTGAPLLDVMLDCRRDAVRDVKALFDIDLEVDISETWNGSPSEHRIEGTDNEEPESGETPGSDEESAGEAEEQPEEAEPEAEQEAEAEPEEAVEEVTEEEVVEATELKLGEDTTHE